MAEYLIQGETLTKIGDQVRAMSETADKLSPDDMELAMRTENTNINSALDSQDLLIDDMIAALQGKAAGNSENLDFELLEQEEKIDELLAILDSKVAGSGAVETCEVTAASMILCWYTDATGNYIEKAIPTAGHPFEVQKNTILVAENDDLSITPIATGLAVKIFDDYDARAAFIVTGDCAIS